MKVTSFADLLIEVKEIKKQQTEVWFRGQGDFTWHLVPSLARRKDGFSKEKLVFETYRKFARKINPSHKDEWELLIDMQHYFVPTRLLDWSESLMIALYFATINHVPGRDAGLFILDPIRLNELSRKNSIPNMPYDTMGLSYVKAYIEKNPYPVPNPIAIKSSYSNDRVMAQKGMFTIHTDSVKGLDEEYPDFVKKYCITDSAVAEIKDLLDFADINEFTIFPDFYGVANYINGTLLR